jgi:hypothetical protein
MSRLEAEALEWADQALPWPELADPFAEHIVPPFPLDTLPEPFRRYCIERAAGSGFDVGGYGFCLLACAANSIDHRARLNVGPFHLPAFCWFGVTGPSGSGKSPILSDTTRAADAINSAMMRDSAAESARWHELAEANKKSPPPRPPWKQRHALDTTTEALAKLLADNPEGVNLYHHEITEFLGRMDAYGGKDGGKDRGVFLRAWDGGTITVNRTSRSPLVVPQFSVGILAGIQPEVLAQKFRSAGNGADGLYQRFLLYCLAPPGRVDYSLRTDADAITQVERIFRTLFDWTRGEPPMVNLSAEAQVAMQDYHNATRILAQRTAATRFAEHIDKFPGFAGRLALALHLIQAAADGTDPLRMVSGDTMAAALRLMGVLYRHSEAVYRILDKEQGQVLALVRSAAEAILGKQWEAFRRGDLTRNATYWQGADGREAEAAIDLLIELGWLRDITPPTIPGKRGRRSSGAFLVNPSVHVSFAGQAERIREARAERYASIQRVAVGSEQ